MASTDKVEVLQMQADYLAHANSGNPPKFSIVNYAMDELITGYAFSKSEITALYNPSNPTPLYMMLGLTSNHASLVLTEQYITPILGRIIGADEFGNNGKIDVNNLVYCNMPLTQPTLMQTFLNTDYKYKTGEVIDPAEAQRMIDNFNDLPEERTLTILHDGIVQPIRAFKITEDDINDILNPTNPLPMVVLPALLDKTKNGLVVNPKQLTFILSNFISSNTYSFNMRDYCLPCPPGCENF